MNSKQRRNFRRHTKRTAGFVMDAVEKLLLDLKENRTTIDKELKGVKEIRTILKTW